MNTSIDTERILDAFLAPEADRLADRVIDAALADIAGTRQRRAPRLPWRFRHMPAPALATGMAAIALVAVVGAAGLISHDAPTPSGPGGPTMTVATPPPTAAPTTTAPVPELSVVAPGISGWTPYTSDVHHFDMGYPEDWTVIAPATREWQPGDRFPADELPYADTFVSPGQGDDQVGLFVWEMPAGEGFDVETVDGLMAWARTFCSDVGASSCEGFTQRAEPMCLDAGGDSCRAAILVPSDGQQYAFFVDWGSAMLTSMPDRVTVVVVARPDDFPAAARYGGSVELLRAILTTMDVWTPGQQQP